MKKEIYVPIGKFIKLHGSLSIPPKSDMLVIFSHGSGSSRFSPRNSFVAEMLNKNGIATLLTDLLTDEEDSIYENRFDIDLLTERLVDVTNYVKQFPELKDFSFGYFGASTGAASALKASAHLSHIVHAVVSRGGRPDLAIDSLKWIEVPTLLIVGSEDEDVIAMNKEAYDLLHCVKRMEIVKGATHLFEEPGKLDEVALLACNWFTKYLKKNKSAFLAE